jgi:cyclopropane fatty-acyl-phospholipid synthase-like methyltransferase
MHVLDLGCERGLTSIFQAKEYDAIVFATDLWISAAENYERIKAIELEER